MGNKYFAYIQNLQLGNIGRAEELLEEIEIIGMLRFGIRCFDPENPICLLPDQAIKGFSSIIQSIGCICGDCSEPQPIGIEFERLQNEYLNPDQQDPIASPPVVPPEPGQPLRF